MLSILLATLLSPQEPEPSWQAHVLSNGVTLHVFTIEDAAKQATMTFLPLGLTSDRLGKAQFSHLAEHMMIRSTDPMKLRVGGILLNGETTNEVLRLESIADQAEWKAALRRHIQWLHARDVDPKVLAREKIRIEGEERSTVSRHLNHKWASVAWTQYVQGASHAAVHADVAGATLAQTKAYLSRIPLRSAMIFTAGPREEEEQIELLEAAIAQVKANAKTKATAEPSEPPVARQDGEGSIKTRETAAEKPETTAQNLTATKPGHRDVTWDLDARHYLEWYLLPRKYSYLEAQVSSQILLGYCFRNPKLKGIPGSTLVSAVRLGDRSALLLSASLTKGVEPEFLQDAFQAIVRSAKPMLRFQANGKLLLRQVLDYETLSRQGRVAKMQDLVGAQHALNVGHACMRSRLSFADMKQAYTAIDAERIGELLDKTCAPSKRHSVRVRQR